LSDSTLLAETCVLRCPLPEPAADALAAESCAAALAVARAPAAPVVVAPPVAVGGWLVSVVWLVLAADTADAAALPRLFTAVVSEACAR
jgi:hypothetical protein